MLDTPELRSKYLDYKFPMKNLGSKGIEDHIKLRFNSSESLDLYYKTISDDGIFKGLVNLDNNYENVLRMTRISSENEKVWFAIYDALTYLNPDPVIFSKEYEDKFGSIRNNIMSGRLTQYDWRLPGNSWVMLYHLITSGDRSKAASSTSSILDHYMANDFSILIEIWRGSVPYRIQARITELFKDFPEELEIWSLWQLTKDSLEFEKDSSKGVDIFDDSLPKSWILHQSIGS